MSIYEIIESIAAIGSTNAKLAIIKANENNKALKNVFFYAYNPRFNFWIKAKTLPKVEGKHDIDSAAFVVLNTLIDREVTGDAARTQVEKFMETLTAEAQEIFARIINHDLRCGASDTLAMKVWPNLVPEYPVLLCDKFNAKTEKHLKQYENNVGYWVDRKCDGGRCLVKVDDEGIVSYHSRNGSTLELFKRFDAQFSKFKNYVFDGELLALKSNGIVESRKVSNGLYTKCVRNSLTKPEAETLCIVIWDAIPLAEYLNGIGTETYDVRRDFLNSQTTFWTNSPVSVVEGKKVYTLAECFESYSQMRERGEEGVIIKVANSVWEDKRSKNYIKLKNTSEGDFKCIGTEEGSGKYKGMIGALVCESSCGKLKFSVGSGFKDEDRVKDPAEYLGRIIEVKYNEVITSKNKTTASLFLPIYSKVRYDKNVANSMAELS